MKQKYFSDNTANHKFTFEIASSSSIIVKKKKYKIQSIIAFLSLLMMFFFTGKISAQTTLWSTGFEESNPSTVSTLSNFNSATFGFQSAGGNFAPKSVKISAPSTGPNKFYDGSVITKNTLTFKVGKYYVVTAYAKQSAGNGSLQIVKSSTSNNYMISEPDAQIILNSAYNVKSDLYMKYTAGFTVNSNETKYVGFRLYSSVDGAQMILDDISIVEYDNVQPENYCTPSVSSGYGSLYYIKKVNFIGNITNSDNASTYTTSPLGYQDQTALGTRASQAQGEGVNIYVETNVGDKANYAKAWVDWNSDGIFGESTEIVYHCTNAFINTTFGFKIPETTIPGNYRIRIRINRSNSKADNTFGACENISNYGETEDYLFTVVGNCTAKITSITNGFNCGTGSVTLGATGTAGSTQYRWYDAQTGGTLVETTASTTWPTPSIAATTTYYVTAFNGSCESLFRTPVVATIKPVPTLTFANANPEVCGENSIIDLQASGNNEQVYLIDENFESGLGSFTSNSIAFPSGEESKTKWQLQSSTYVPSYPAFPVWYPAISSGFGTNKFAMSTSDVVTGGTTFGKVENALESATVNTVNYLNLTLSFKIYFSSYNDLNSQTSEYVIVEYKNGTGAWTAVPGQQYLSDIGIGTQFITKSFDMSDYKNIAALQIRIRYKAGWCDGVAIDDIKLFGDKPLSPSFQWTSALPIDAYTNAACTLPYTAGTPVSTVYVKPTLAQLEQSTYSFTAKANLANGCSTSAIINVTNKSKVWQNLTTDWNNASNWKPVGVPTTDNCVIIPSTSIIPVIPNPGALAKNLTVKSTGNLELSTGSNLTVTDFVKVETNGIFNIKNNANLVQINNAANTGTVNIERITQPMNRYDFTYWGSPLSTNFTLGSLSPATLYDKYFSWIPSINGLNGNWKYENTTTVMTPGKGYIVRAPQSFNISGSKSTYTAKFSGTPNNGDVLIPITYGTMGSGQTNDKWNLLANPYPSAINAGTFLDTNSALLNGTIYFWTHNTIPLNSTPDPFYGDFVYNYTDQDYACWNKTGGVATAALSGGGVLPNGSIASGQAFFALSLGTAPSGTNAIFKNIMRKTAGGSTYTNSQFFKQVKNNKSNNIPEKNTEVNEGKHRIWLNLTNNSGAFSQILVGYVAGATQDRDRSYDGELMGGNDVTFYSIIPNVNLTIQGRALPFDENDQVILGYNSAITGDISIRIDHIDGLFNTQNIYLEDKRLSIIHNLKEKPYVFNTEKGDFNDRFVLRYTDKTLGTNTFNLSKSDEVNVIVNQNVTVQSSNQLIKNIDVYDLSGRKVDSYKKVNVLKYTLNHLNKNTAGLIVKITLENDTIVSKKIIY